MRRLQMSALVLAVLAPAGLAAVAAAQPVPPPPVCATPAERSDYEPTLRIGCASDANLRAMLADPADLDRGRAPTPAQGDAAVAAAQRHRQDQVKPLSGGQGQDSGGGAGAEAGAQPAKGY